MPRRTKALALARTCQRTGEPPAPEQRHRGWEGAQTCASACCGVSVREGAYTPTLVLCTVSCRALLDCCAFFSRAARRRERLLDVWRTFLSPLVRGRRRCCGCCDGRGRDLDLDRDRDAALAWGLSLPRAATLCDAVSACFTVRPVWRVDTRERGGGERDRATTTPLVKPESTFAATFLMRGLRPGPWTARLGDGLRCGLGDESRTTPDGIHGIGLGLGAAAPAPSAPSLPRLLRSRPRLSWCEGGCESGVGSGVS